MRPRALAGRTVVALVAGLVCVVASGPAASAQTLEWSKLAPVPARAEGVEGMSVALVGDIIVAAYGYSEGDTRGTRIYSIDQDRWKSGAKAPGPARSEGTAVADEFYVYSIGGRAGRVLSDLDRYSPRENKWISLPDMPTPRAGLASAIVGGDIYAIGGRRATGGPCSQGPGGQLAKVERFDIATRRWTEVAPMPLARSDLAAAVVHGRIFVFGGCRVTRGPGGRARTSYLANVSVYDPATDSWSAAPANMPTARAAMYAVATLGGQIVVPGGWAGGDDPLGVVQIYSARHDDWRSAPRMLTARAEMGVVSRGGFVFAVGGAVPAFGASVNSNEVLGPA
jgi:hypothetical protein